MTKNEDIRWGYEITAEDNYDYPHRIKNIPANVKAYNPEQVKLVEQFYQHCLLLANIGKHTPNQQFAFEGSNYVLVNKGVDNKSGFNDTEFV